MEVSKIGNYTILKSGNIKQIYGQDDMLQVSEDKKYFVDTQRMRVIKLIPVLEKDTFERHHEEFDKI